MQFIELNDGTVQQVSSELGCAAAKLAKADGHRMADMLAQSLSTKVCFVGTTWSIGSDGGYVGAAEFTVGVIRLTVGTHHVGASKRRDGGGFHDFYTARGKATAKEILGGILSALM